MGTFIVEWGRYGKYNGGSIRRIASWVWSFHMLAMMVLMEQGMHVDAICGRGQMERHTVKPLGSMYHLLTGYGRYLY